MKLVKCIKCKWVHFEVEPEPEPLIHITAYRPLDYHPPGISTCCFRCGNSYKNFEDALYCDVPNGSTIQSILKREEIK